MMTKKLIQRGISLIIALALLVTTMQMNMVPVKASMKLADTAHRSDALTPSETLSLGSSVSGSINEATPAAIYRITVPNGSSIEMDVTVSAGISKLKVHIYDEDGYAIFHSNDNTSWNSDTELLAFRTTVYLDSGNYYIAILRNDYKGDYYYEVDNKYYSDGSDYFYSGEFKGDYSETQIGDYTLSTSYKKMENIDLSYDGSIASAHEISLNQSFTGVLAMTDEFDIYKIQVLSPGVLNCGFTYYMDGIYLYLWDENGEELSKKTFYSYDTGKKQNLSYPLETGTYYIGVSLYDYYTNYAGKYTFANSFQTINSSESEKNDTILTANPISIGKEVRGMLGMGESSDIFKITVPSAGYVRVLFDSDIGDCQVITYDKSGFKVQSENAYSGQYEYTYSLAAGDYYFQILSSSNNGCYTLQVVKPATISKVKVASIKTQTYAGKYLTPKVTVTYNSKVLKKGTDYTLSYSNNYYPGTAKVTITGKGVYTGTVTKSFKIIPKSVKITKVSNSSKKSATLMWTRNYNASGYEITYATNKSFKSAKKKMVSWGSTTSVTLTKLKKGKTYYVRVRAYYISGTKKIYSAYSNVKSVKIKK